MMKKRLLAGLACAALLAAPGTALADSTDVNLYVNDAYIGGSAADGQAYINDDGRTMVPLRIVGFAMGYETEWSDGTIHVTGEGGAVDVTMTVGETAYTANGQAGTFETAPVIKDGRTYLPARDFSEIYGNVYWDGETRSVFIIGDTDMDFMVLGDDVVQIDGDGVHRLTLPERYQLTERGQQTAAISDVLGPRTFDGVTYMTVNYDGDFSGKLPLFRLDGDQLTYLTDIYGGAPYCVYADNIVYYTEALGAGAWDPAEHPTYLYVEQLKDDPYSEAMTRVYDVGFDVSKYDLQMINDKITAVAGEEQIPIALEYMTPIASWTSQQ